MYLYKFCNMKEDHMVRKALTIGCLFLFPFSLLTFLAVSKPAEATNFPTMVLCKKCKEWHVIGSPCPNE